MAQAIRIAAYFLATPLTLHRATSLIRKLDPNILPLSRINTKWIRTLTVKNETTQLLEENMGGFIYTLGVGKVFL